MAPVRHARVRALIVDDEPLARERLRTLLAREEDVEVVAECGNGREALEAIEREDPELLFLDIQMPEVDGFEMLEALPPERMPVVVFVTAYDAFALRAFEAHAIDYLLKPFDRARFQVALERARRQLGGGGGERLDPRVLSLLEGLRAESGRPLRRLAVRTGGKIRLLDVEEIDALEADGNYVRIHVGERSYLLRETLSRLEERLDGQRFLRVHRSTIVNVGRIVEMEPLFQGEFVLTLRGGKKVTSSRSYRPRLQEAFDLQ